MRTERGGGGLEEQLRSASLLGLVTRARTLREDGRSAERLRLHGLGALPVDVDERDGCSCAGGASGGSAVAAALVAACTGALARTRRGDDDERGEEVGGVVDEEVGACATREAMQPLGVPLEDRWA